MVNQETLSRLADLAGIEPFYWDIFGHKHVTSEETKKALLRAMGIDAVSPQAVQGGLLSLEEAPWRRLLAPVYTWRLGNGPPWVAVALPAASPEQVLRWSVEREDGKILEDEVRLGRLTRNGRREIDGRTVERACLPLPAGLSEGYHRLRVHCLDGEAESLLIVAPPRAYLPERLSKGERLWGVACHLYELRSAANWGIGDFSDLETLSGAMSGLGASLIGLNPLHALFPDNPRHASPYSPSSRLFLNPLYLDVTAIPDFASCEEARRLSESEAFAARIDRARRASHVNYPEVSALKMEVLECLHAWFEARHPAGPEADGRRQAFDAFVAEGGERLRRFALFQALQENFAGRPWRQWPEQFRRPDTAAAFAEANEDRIRFHMYLQWEADRQLASVSQKCAADGMPIGLFRDLAVGANPKSAEAWSEQDVLADGASFGVPPDAFNPDGQNWGFPPLNPIRLKESAYATFLSILRANMRHAGALRIDHVMALRHLFWIPGGESAVAGAYVRYPLKDMLAILALESHRNRCLIVGEDLGTVPEGFRERMMGEGILSYRLFYFERHDDGLFRRPDTYPPLALATATTHDLPTIAGHWLGQDLAARREMGMSPRQDGPTGEPDSGGSTPESARKNDREVLLAALKDQKLIPDDFPLEAQAGERLLQRLTLAIHRFLARTPAQLMLVNLDDLLLEPDQLNVPGTVAEYPNWRRKLSCTNEALASNPYVVETAAAIARERREAKARAHPV